MNKKTLKLENTIEAKSVKYIEDEGYYAIKILRTGWPDRLIQLKNGYCFYIEFKRPKKPSKTHEKLQKHIHKELRLLGTSVYTADSVDQVKGILNLEVAKCEYKT